MPFIHQAFGGDPGSPSPLERKTGPFLWQLPATYRFEATRLDDFIRSLPKDSRAAERVAKGHDHRLRRGALVRSRERVTTDMRSRSGTHRTSATSSTTSSGDTTANL
jgi:uncharacterized protein YecE (DUF72 family)